MDEAVALVDFNGLLIVFGRDSIIVYENADDVDNMGIIEGISGMGCIARDTVQVIGKDVIFLSDTGLRSLGRSLSDEAMPLTDLSSHVRDTLVLEALAETPVQIKSMYNSLDGYYIISLPLLGKSWYFDLKFPNEDQTLKASTWAFGPTCMMQTQNHDVYMGVTAGFMSEMIGNFDEADSSGANGNSYSLIYEGVWNDFSGVDETVANLTKILKTANVLGSGTPSAPVTLKWAVDYSTVFAEVQLLFDQNPPTQYGIGQYGVDTYASTGDFERVRGSMSRSGQVIKIGIETTIAGNSFALQRIDILAKVGRLAL
jgi:hypothetical protein